jgi:hypothetical protein
LSRYECLAAACIMPFDVFTANEPVQLADDIKPLATDVENDYFPSFIVFSALAWAQERNRLTTDIWAELRTATYPHEYKNLHGKPRWSNKMNRKREKKCIQLDQPAWNPGGASATPQSRKNPVFDCAVALCTMQNALLVISNLTWLDLILPLKSVISTKSSPFLTSHWSKFVSIKKTSYTRIQGAYIFFANLNGKFITLLFFLLRNLLEMSPLLCKMIDF